MWQKDTKSGAHKARVVRGPNHGQFQYDLMYTIYRSVDLNQFSKLSAIIGPTKKQHETKTTPTKTPGVFNSCDITNKNCRPSKWRRKVFPSSRCFFFRSQATLFSKKLVLPCKEMSSIQSKGFEEPKSLPWKNRLGNRPPKSSVTSWWFQPL